MPLIYERGVPVHESAVIVEYLEERWHGHGAALLPPDPLLRAAVRAFVSSLSFLPFYALLKNTDASKAEELKAGCVAAAEGIEARFSAPFAPAHPGASLSRLSLENGPFFLGRDLSAADVAVLPFFDRLVPGLKAHRGFDLFASSKTPRIIAALDAARSRPAWAATSQSADVYIAAYEGYAQGKPGVPMRVRRPPVAATTV